MEHLVSEKVVSLAGRRKPPPPPRRARIRPLGAFMPGRIVTWREEGMVPDGQDWAIPWKLIAVRDRALVVYGKGTVQDHSVAMATNDNQE